MEYFVHRPRLAPPVLQPVLLATLHRRENLASTNRMQGSRKIEAHFLAMFDRLS